MTELTSETRELSIDELETISGGEIAIDKAADAYMAMLGRLAAAVQGPSLPKISLHF